MSFTHSPSHQTDFHDSLLEYESTSVPHELEEYFYAKIHNLTTGRKEIQKNVCQFSNSFFFKVVTTLQRTKVTVFVVKYLFKTKRFFKDCSGRRSSRCQGDKDNMRDEDF